MVNYWYDGELWYFYGTWYTATSVEWQPAELKITSNNKMENSDGENANC